MAIGELTDCVLGGFEKGLDTHASFYDLTKAFDCVSHNILLKKLSYYGFGDDSISLMGSYLKDRFQFVSYNGQHSSNEIIRFGVPQGSVLGPTLFLIYINDITNAQHDSNLILFADDMTTYRSYNPILIDPNITVGDMQSNIQNWFLANGLCLNSSKTQLVNFSLRMGGRPLVGASGTAKFLGVYLDSKLTWEEHAVYLSKKLSKIVHLIKGLTSNISFSTVLAAYHGCFMSVASYAIFSWGHSPHSELIFKLQRRCVRVMTGLRYRDCCRHQFIRLKILTLPCIYILHCLIYVKRHIVLYPTHSEQHSYPTRKNNDLNVRFLRLAKSRSGSEYYGPRLFNALPPLIRNLDEGLFKRRLKAFLASKAFYSLGEFLNDSFDSML